MSRSELKVLKLTVMVTPTDMRVLKALAASADVSASHIVRMLIRTQRELADVSPRKASAK